jgi:hypothetical protein
VIAARTRSRSLAPPTVDPTFPLATRPDHGRDVAILLRTRTFSGYSGGDDIGVFTADTRPTADDVDVVIDHASDEVLA